MTDPGSGRWLGDVPIAQVWAREERNPRSRRSDSSQGALTNSVASWGMVLEPLLTVREAGPEGEVYRVIAGYSRLRAARDAGLAVVPIVVDDFPANLRQNTSFASDLSEETANRLAALTENMTRADLGDWDVAHALYLLAQEGLSPMQIALVLAENDGQRRLSLESIRNYVSIGGFPESLKAKLRPLGKEGFRIAKRLVRLPYLRLGSHWRQPETDEVIQSMLDEVKEKPKLTVRREGEEREKGWIARAKNVRTSLSSYTPENATEKCIAEAIYYLAGGPKPISSHAVNVLRRLGK